MSCCKSAYGDHEVRGCHRKNEDRTAWRGKVEADDIEAGDRTAWRGKVEADDIE